MEGFLVKNKEQIVNNNVIHQGFPFIKGGLDEFLGCPKNMVMDSLVLWIDPNLGYSRILDINDLSTRNNTIASFSGARLVEDNPRYISFSGNTTDQILLTSNPILRPGTSNFSLQLWAFQTIQSGQQGAYIDTRNNGLATNSFAFYPSGNPFRLSYFSNNVNFVGTSILRANTWFNLAITRINGQITLYVNGIAETRGASNTNLTDTNYFIGFNFSNRSINGRIGQILQYNRGLTESEILQNYNATKFIYA